MLTCSSHIISVPSLPHLLNSIVATLVVLVYSGAQTLLCLSSSGYPQNTMSKTRQVIALAAVGNLGKYTCEEIVANDRFDVVVISRQVITSGSFLPNSTGGTDV
jgi:hypothetical protein